MDAEGNFLIQSVENRFKLVFTLCLHIDEAPLLYYIAQRLGVGNISVRDKTVIFTVISKDVKSTFYSMHTGKIRLCKRVVAPKTTIKS